MSQPGAFSHVGANSRAASRHQPNRTGRAGPTPAAGAALVQATRSDADSRLPSGPALPSELAETLSVLTQNLHDCKPDAAHFRDLEAVFLNLHDFQFDIETAMREHAKQPQVAALRRAALGFVQRLDAGLQGKAAAPDGSDSEPFDRLPLSWLDITRIHMLCLGVSILVSNPKLPVFPETEFDKAGTALSSIVAKLMRQVAALAEDAEDASFMKRGELLDIHNLIRRLVVAGLLDPRHSDQKATRMFCSRVFKTAQGWAEKEGTSLLTPLPVVPEKNAQALETKEMGKLSAQLEMLYDHGLTGASRKVQSEAFVKILSWLLGSASMNQMLGESNLVPFSSVVNLVKRFLEQGKLDAGDRRLDAMWSGIVGAIAGADATRMVGGDGRIHSSFANVLRVMLDQGLPQKWREAALQTQGADLDKLQALRTKFAAAWFQVLATVCDPAFDAVHDLQTISNLFSAVKACDKHLPDIAGSASTDPAPTVKSMRAAASRLVQALPQARLPALQGGQAVGGLLTGLGYAWKRGLVMATGKPVQCLLSLVDNLIAIKQWAPQHRGAVVQVLTWLLASQLVSRERLAPVLTSVLGKGDWSDAALQAHLSNCPEVEPVEVLHLQVDEAIEAPEKSPRRPSPRLVGETRLKPAPPALTESSSTPAPRPSSGAAHLSRALKSEAGSETGFLMPTKTARRHSDQAASRASGASAALAVAGTASTGTATTSTTSNTRITTTKSTTSNTRVATTTSTTSNSRITTTTAAASTTTTTAISPAPVPPRSVVKPPAPDAAQRRQEWLDLVQLKAADPHVKLLRLARAHPDLLQVLDAQGHGLLWHLLLSGKPQSLAKLIGMPGWKPQLSPELEGEVLRCLGEIDCAPAVKDAVKSLLPSLKADQRKRLNESLNAVPEDPAIKLSNKLNHAILVADAQQVAALMLAPAFTKLPSMQTEQLLVVAIQNGDVGVVKQLLACPAFQARLGARHKDYGSVLHIALIGLAAEEGMGADALKILRWRQLISLLISHVSVRMAARLSHPDFDTALALAISMDNPEVVREMLQYKEFNQSLIDCRIGGLPPLHRVVVEGVKVKFPGAGALKEKHQQSLKLLDVFLGAASARSLHLLMHADMLALEAAATSGVEDVTRILLQHRDVYREIDWSRRPSMVARAAEAEAWGLLPDLLNIDVFAAHAGKAGNAEKTALFCAISAGNVRAVALLLQQGSVRDSVFVMCPHGAGREGTFTPARKVFLDAPGMAIQTGQTAVLDTLLELPQVSRHLQANPEYKAKLIEQARKKGLQEVVERLQQLQ